MKRILEQLVCIPVEYPGVQKRIDMRYKGIGHVKGQRPQHNDGQEDKKQKDKQVYPHVLRYLHFTMLEKSRELLKNGFRMENST